MIDKGRLLTRIMPEVRPGVTTRIPSEFEFRSSADFYGTDRRLSIYRNGRQTDTPLISADAGGWM